jgi:hypothetical protein
VIEIIRQKLGYQVRKIELEGVKPVHYWFRKVTLMGHLAYSLPPIRRLNLVIRGSICFDCCSDEGTSFSQTMKWLPSLLLILIASLSQNITWADVTS